jgi:dienelactone hydrolase
VGFALLPRFTVRDVERLSIGSAGVPALLVGPEAPGAHPAAIIQHGYRAAKEDLLPLAVYLAAYGFVSLLPDAWGHGERLPERGPSWQSETSPDYFVEVTRHTVAGLREALGVLAARPEVRADALVVGGFSMGAIASLIVGTEDARVAGVVSIAGSPLPDLMGTRLFDSQVPDEAAARWARGHDAATHIAHLAPRPLLLSHGRGDDMVPVAGALRLFEAAQPHYATHPERLALLLYDHRHSVTPEQVGDVVNWIAPLFLSDEDEAADDAAMRAG